MPAVKGDVILNIVSSIVSAFPSLSGRLLRFPHIQQQRCRPINNEVKTVIPLVFIPLVKLRVIPFQTKRVNLGLCLLLKERHLLRLSEVLLVIDYSGLPLLESF